MKISNKVMKSLERSGWNSFRNIDITIYEEALKREGYTLSETIKNFLRQFGEMEIIIPALRRPNAFDKVFIDPVRAIDGIYRGV